MDSIIIRVDDLFQMARSLQKHKMTFVKLSLFEAEPVNEIPAQITFSGIPFRNSDYSEDFGEIDAAESVTAD